MFKRKIIAIGLLGALTALAHGQDAAKKDPKTGKNCVSYVSSELSENGVRLRLNFRNTCATAFEIRIPVGAKTRKKTIEAAEVDKPTKAYVTCLPNEGCESAKWVYE